MGIFDKKTKKVEVVDSDDELRAAAEDLCRHKYSQYLPKQAPEAWERLVQETMAQMKASNEASKPWQY